MINIFSIILVLLITNSLSAATCSTDVCTIADSTTVDVSRHTLCTSVTNTTGKSLLVGTKTQAELQSFISAGAISGIAKAACGTKTAPSFVASREISGVTGATCTVVKPAGLAVGDLMIALIYNNAAETAFNSPGFTAISGIYGPHCTSYYAGTYYRVADAAAVAASDFTFTRASGSFTDCGLMIVAFRGASTTSPIEGNSRTGGSGGTVTYPSVTVSTALNALSLAIGEACDSPAPDAPSSPAGYSSIANFISQYTRFSTKTITSYGATGAITGNNPAGTGWIGHQIVINPL